MNKADNSRNWSSTQLKYMAWLALPKADRKPKNDTDIAKEIGVDVRTLRRWKHLPDFWENVRNEGRANLRVSIGRIYDALIKEAEEGSYQHIKLCLEMLGEHTDKINIQAYWYDELIPLIKSGELSYQILATDLKSDDLAQELFAKAGVDIV